MMIKAEIAKEMIRSRTHTPIPAPRRTGGVKAASEATLADGAGAVASSAEPDSENVPGMRSYCIQNLSRWEGVVLDSRRNRKLRPSALPALLRCRLQWLNTRTFHGTLFIPEQDCLPRPDPGFPFPCNNHERVGRMGLDARRRRHSGL